MVTLDEAFDRTMGHEGNYVNDPDDPGGETNWGISKRSYPNVDIKNLTRENAKAIWERDFWNPVARLVTHRSVVFQLCDAAYNHGFGNAVRILQRAVDTADDGHWGKNSMGRYMTYSENDILLRFIAYRTKFFIKLTTFSKYGRGWMDRIANNLLYAAQDNLD